MNKTTSNSGGTVIMDGSSTAAACGNYTIVFELDDSHELT